MKTYKKLLTTMILLLVLAGFIYVYEIKTSETANIMSYVVKDINKTNDFIDPLQYYPNMRFAKSILFYNIDKGCSGLQKQRIKDAFEIISNKTDLLKFYPKDILEDISIVCNETTPEISKGFTKTGEGGAYSITNTGIFYLIKQGKVSIYGNKKTCEMPNTELHEILHVMGFKHSENPKSIMYNVSDCNQELTPEIVERLNQLYNLESLPDLAFDNLEISKNLFYLNFKSEISNKGLEESGNVSLEIYSKNKILKTFELGNLKPGQGKIIDVKNLFIRGTKELKFILTGKKELNMTNNLEEVSV